MNAPLPLKKPELLLPAGSLAHLRHAYAFGADAVYAGQPGYSLRARHNAFGLDELAQGMEEAHRLGKKFYLTSNLLPHNDRVRTYLRDLAPIVALQPDGIVMADPGLITMVLDLMHSGTWNPVPIHLSVQANTTNHLGVKFWAKQGVKRIILSRELSLDEVEALRNECPDVELEVLVHGSLCIAYSGRCLLSGYFNRRNPELNQNPGSAFNETDSPARLGADFSFASEQQQADSAFAACGGSPRHPAANQMYLLEEAERPGQLMPIMEDEHGTYIMNSKDLRAVEHVARLVGMGVDALKIEGRTKSPYYVARTAQVYRQAIDDAAAGRPFNPMLVAQLESLAPRGYTSGFMERRPTQDLQAYEAGGPHAQASQLVGEVLSAADDWVEVKAGQPLAVGDNLALVHPSGNRTMKLEQLKNAESQPMETTSANGQTVWLAVPGPAEASLGGWVTKIN